MKKVLGVIIVTLVLMACSKEVNQPTDTTIKTEGKTTTEKIATDHIPNRVAYLEVSPKTEKCIAGAVLFDCLQVKHVDYKDGHKIYQNSEWENFYVGIDGFKHDATHQVVIKVREYDLPHPPAGESNIRYVLDKVIETQPAQ